MPTPQSTKAKMADVQHEIERWESLLAQEGDTRWESFAKASIDISRPQYSVRFEQGDGLNSADKSRVNSMFQGGEVSINEQMTSTMEQLIEKNIQLTEELDAFRERSTRELVVMEDNALKEKSRADELQKTLDELRLNVGDYLNVPSDAKARSKKEQEFWDKVATPSLLHSSHPPTYFSEEQSARAPPGKIVLPLSSHETDNFRAAYQRLVIENDELKEEVKKLKRINETRRPMIQRLSNTAKSQVANHKRQLMAAVRRIDFLVAERDDAVKKCEQMKKYVTKLEMKALKVRSGSQQQQQQQQQQTDGNEVRSMYHRIGTAGRGAQADQEHEEKEAQVLSGIMGRMGGAINNFGTRDIAKLYAAASEKSRKQGSKNVQNDLKMTGGASVTGELVEGRRRLELSKKPKGSATLAISPQVGGRSRNRERGGDRDRSHSPGQLEEDLLESMMLDREVDDATEGVDAISLRLQQNFSAIYSSGGGRGGEERAEANSTEGTVPLPAEIS